MIIQVGEAIGIVPTLALLILDGFARRCAGASQGRAAWERFNRGAGGGRVPAKETFDGAMIIVGGAFLLAPGFITDVIGFLLLIPPTRRAVPRARRPARPRPRCRSRSGAAVRRRAERRWAPRRPRPPPRPRLRLRGHRARGHRHERQLAVEARRTERRRGRWSSGPAGEAAAIRWRADGLATMLDRRGTPSASGGSAASSTGTRSRASGVVSAPSSTTAAARRSPPLRPAGARGPRRGASLAGGHRSDGEPVERSTRRCSRPSTAPDGLPRRVGLELWTDAEDSSRCASPALISPARPRPPTSRRDRSFLALASRRGRRRRSALRGPAPGVTDAPIRAVDLRLRRRADDAAARTRSPPSRTRPGSPPRRSGGRCSDRRARRRAPALRARGGRDQPRPTSSTGSPTRSSRARPRPEMHRFNEIYFEALDAQRADDRADARAAADAATGWRC